MFLAAKQGAPGSCSVWKEPHSKQPVAEAWNAFLWEAVVALVAPELFRQLTGQLRMEILKEKDFRGGSLNL